VAPLDPSGWSFYCNHCEARRDAMLLQERNVSTGEEYFELVCTACGFILLSMERKDLAERLKEQHLN
jgi:DNA-directed RNA polymerase subunit RPC12/RpoP